MTSELWMCQYFNVRPPLFCVKNSVSLFCVKTTVEDRLQPACHTGVHDVVAQIAVGTCHASTTHWLRSQLVGCNRKVA